MNIIQKKERIPLVSSSIAQCNISIVSTDNTKHRKVSTEVTSEDDKQHIPSVASSSKARPRIRPLKAKGRCNE